MARTHQLLFATLTTLFAMSRSTFANYPTTWTPDPLWSDFYQESPGVVNGLNMCAPVSCTDAFYWLANKFALPNLIQTPWQAEANSLAAANYMKTNLYNTTYSGYYASGESSYITNAGYGSLLSQTTALPGAGQAPPTIDAIKTAIASGEVVQLEIGWITDNVTGNDFWDNGHFVDANGYDLNNLLVADPLTNNNIPSNDSLQILGSASLTFGFDAFGNSASSYTYNYPVVKLNNWDITGKYNYQIIYGMITESTVQPAPEPASLSVLAAGLLILATKRTEK